MDAQLDPLAEARLYGRLEAERLDLALRDLEARERDERRMCPDPESTEEEAGSAARQVPAEVWRLQQEVQQLQEFRRAVLDSRSWRWMQRLRRLVGRAW